MTGINVQGEDQALPSGSGSGSSATLRTPVDRSTETQSDEEIVRTRTEACQRIIDDAMSGLLSGETFITKLRETGITAEEAEDFINQLEQRQAQQGTNPDSEPRPSSPIPNSVRDNPNPVNTADSLAWAVLRAKVDQLRGNDSENSRRIPNGLISNEMANLFGLSPSEGSIPASVLAKAPYLANLSDGGVSDLHLETTQDLLIAFSPAGVQETLISKAQLANLAVPLPRSIWRKIILDQYIDFEKLFASMEKGYDHQDDPKDFGGGYALVKKDQAFSKRALHSEAEWTRVYDAWSAATSLFFRHRENELRNYRSIVMDLFRAASKNPLVAIEFDIEVRDKYARKPFHLDNRDYLNFPLLSQMFRGTGPSSQLRSSIKRPIGSSSGGNTKRVDVPCRNWSFGSCKTDPCPNKRKHGVCCVCGGDHRAKDNESCFIKLQSRN